jgi:hypothetical protein
MCGSGSMSSTCVDGIAKLCRFPVGQCSAGCDASFLGNGFCNKECFTSSCAWSVTGFLPSDPPIRPFTVSVLLSSLCVGMVATARSATRLKLVDTAIVTPTPAACQQITIWRVAPARVTLLVCVKRCTRTHQSLLLRLVSCLGWLVTADANPCATCPHVPTTAVTATCVPSQLPR